MAHLLRMFFGPTGRGSILALALIGFLVQAADLHAQTQDDMNVLMEIFAHHPLTGEELPADRPHPIGGLIGDGVPDKIPYMLRVSYEAAEVEGAPTGDEIGNDLVWGNTVVDIAVAAQGGPSSRDDFYGFQENVSFVEHMEANPEDVGFLTNDSRERRARNQERWMAGEIDLPFDILPETILQMRAILKRNDVPIDTVTTEIRPAMPELRFTSTIISRNMENAIEGLEITGTVAGRTGLEFTDGYLTLSGRGELTYEDFHVMARSFTAPLGSCNFLTSTSDGYFTVPEIVLFEDRLPPPVPAPRWRCPRPSSASSPASTSRSRSTVRCHP